LLQSEAVRLPLGQANNKLSYWSTQKYGTVEDEVGLNLEKVVPFVLHMFRVHLRKQRNRYHIFEVKKVNQG
jgi:hypothetical protein